MSINKNNTNIFLIFLFLSAPLYCMNETYQDKNLEENYEQELHDVIIKELENSNNLDFNLDLIKNIINKGVKINKLKTEFFDFLVAFMGNRDHVISKNAFEIWKFIVELDFYDINKEIYNSQTILQLAAQYGSPDVIKTLLKNKNIDVNYKNQSKECPLYISISCPIYDTLALEATKLFLEHRSINVFIKSNLTLYCNAENIKDQSISCLEFAKLQKKHYSKNKFTHYDIILNKLIESRNQLFESIKDEKNLDLETFNSCLLKLGIYAKDKKNNNILHIAIKKKNKACIYKILLLAPDLIYRKNSSRLTPFDLALQNADSKNSILKDIIQFAYAFKRASEII